MREIHYPSDEHSCPGIGVTCKTKAQEVTRLRVQRCALNQGGDDPLHMTVSLEAKFKNICTYQRRRGSNIDRGLAKGSMNVPYLVR